MIISKKEIYRLFLDIDEAVLLAQALENYKEYCQTSADSEMKGSWIYKDFVEKSQNASKIAEQIREALR